MTLASYLMYKNIRMAFLFKILLGASKPTAWRPLPQYKREKKREQRIETKPTSMGKKTDAFRSEDESELQDDWDFCLEDLDRKSTKMPGTHQDFRAYLSSCPPESSASSNPTTPALQATPNLLKLSSTQPLCLNSKTCPWPLYCEREA